MRSRALWTLCLYTLTSICAPRPAVGVPPDPPEAGKTSSIASSGPPAKLPLAHPAKSQKQLEKEARAKSKRHWRHAKRCAYSVIWAAALMGGSWFWAVPAAQDYFAARRQQADIAYTETVLPKYMNEYGDNTRLIETDMKRAAVYLMPLLHWDEVYRVLLEVDEESGEISRYAVELGLPKNLLHDSRTWGTYFRATPDMDAIAKLIARAVTLDWLRYRDALGLDLAGEVTVQDLLIRQLEKGRDGD